MHGSSVASFPGEGFAPTGVIASPFGSGLLSDRCNGIGECAFLRMETLCMHSAFPRCARWGATEVAGGDEVSLPQFEAKYLACEAQKQCRWPSLALDSVIAAHPAILYMHV